MKSKILRSCIVCLGILCMAKASWGQNIKKPNVAGQFYPASPKELSVQIDQLMNQSPQQSFSRFVPVVIAPHAGYVYSGGVAAYSFKAVSQHKYKTVVILAPGHFYGFDGISIWKDGMFETPLGMVQIDEDITAKLVGAAPKFIFDKKAFDQEHSLEVEIPFLQKTMSDFKIVPVVMGQASFQTLKEFAVKLSEVIGTREDVLIVVSTDFSHYHDDETAKQMDERAIQAILQLDAEQIYRSCFDRQGMEMCGCIPVTTALLYAREQGFHKVEKLHYANSGDVTGDLSRVVGYSALVIYRNDEKLMTKEMDGVQSLSNAQKKKLIEIARQTIRDYVQHRSIYQTTESDPGLNAGEGAFVTIHKQGELRGCIGNIIGKGPLYLTVRNMAVAASSEDPRFHPVEANELDELEVEISVLSQPKIVPGADGIVMGKHGVIISRGMNSGVFLPQVATETGWSREEFLSELCGQKAGLPRDCWQDPNTKIEIFTADVFSEKDIK